MSDPGLRRFEQQVRDYYRPQQEYPMSIDRKTADERPLQGDHSNHHPASPVPDRDVTLTSNQHVPAGTNPIAKTDMGTGAEQPPTDRDLEAPPSIDGATGQEKPMKVTPSESRGGENEHRGKPIIKNEAPGLNK
jgi:hypothetical protein